jgi:hypothetical protein
MPTAEEIKIRIDKWSGNMPPVVKFKPQYTKKKKRKN